MVASMSEPTRIAVAIGLAALGRQVLCARPWDEPTREIEAAIMEAIGFNAAFSYRREGAIVAHEPTDGSVVFINAGLWERALGREYHHMIGGVHLRPDQRARLSTLVRLKP